MKVAAALLFTACLAIASFTTAVDADGVRTLVLVDDLAIERTHSEFLKGLKIDGLEPEVHMYDEKELQLSRHGQWLWDNIVLLTPTVSDFRKAKKGGRNSNGVKVASLLEFIDAGGNLLLAVSGKGESEYMRPVGDDLRRIANECGVDFDPEGLAVVDHHAYSSEADAGDHTYIAARELSGEGPIAGHMDAPVLFRGVGHMLQPSNPLTFPVLRGNPTTFTAVPLDSQGKVSLQQSPNKSLVEGGPQGVGSEVLLISAMQAENNARVLVVGSADLFSDAAGKVSRFTMKFASEIAAWAFKRRGVLRATNVRHRKVGESAAPYMYRIKDELTFEVDIEEFKYGKWVPYERSDVQLEFTMLDPYVRRFLTPPTKEGSSTFSTTFKTPDQYGIFKFVIDYRRLGYTTLHLEEQAPLRNYKHSDYERFLFCAYPYYGAAFSTLIATLAFSFFFLHHKETCPKAALPVTPY
eukprot:GDKI01002615.1.p1 GENE.GDKI01002615.1~~GDKI01002615.1.p1  ORF type:complete len:466 (-),score=177.24 GDKI01002615.1:347-1744(-)